MEAGAIGNDVALGSAIGAALAFVVWAVQAILMHVIRGRRLRVYLCERISQQLDDYGMLVKSLSEDVDLIAVQGYPNLARDYERGDTSELRSLIDRSVTVLRVTELRNASRLVDAMGSLDALIYSVHHHAADLLRAHKLQEEKDMLLLQYEWARLVDLHNTMPSTPVRSLDALPRQYQRYD